jgi:hypothetical protein
MKYLLVFSMIILAGCAADSHWARANTTFDDFNRDQAQCSAQAWSIPNAGAFQIAMVEYKCMQGKGYEKVETKKQ